MYKKQKPLRIGEAADYLGISAQSLRNSEKEGKIYPCGKSAKGKHRYFTLESLETYAREHMGMVSTKGVRGNAK